MSPTRRLPETELIAHLARLARGAGVRPRGLVAGIGDDAAIVRGNGEDLVITQDALVERRHFRREWMGPQIIGRRAAAVNLSDIAAMGARPRYAFVSLHVPRGESPRFVRAAERGVIAQCAEYGAAVVGGNITSTDGPLAIDITLVGACAPGRAWRRRARPGDAIVVAGALGEAALGLALLREKSRARGRAVQAYRQPVARLDVARRLSGNGAIHGAIDVSDGISTDLLHVCTASDTGCEVDADALPVSRRLRGYCGVHALDPVDWILRGGDDYALLLAVAPRRAGAVCRAIAALGVVVSRVGTFTDSAGAYRLVRGERTIGRIAPTGFDHLR